MGRNASPSSFGWDFQVNAALILMLENIEEAQSVRVEGETEDIEIKLNNGQYIYSQAKSVINRDDYSHVKEKLNKAITTLNDAASHNNFKKLIYITNSPNPFNSQKTMSAFYGHTRLAFSELPSVCQKSIDKMISSLTCKNLDTSKFEVHVIPFFTDNLFERYKVIQSVVDEFLYKLNHGTRGMAETIMEIWQKDFFENSTKNDTLITIKKSDLVWPIIVLQSQLHPDHDILQDYDESQIEEIIHKYGELINNRTERFEFITKVITDYQAFKDGVGREKMANFIAANWINYKNEFVLDDLEADIAEIVTKIILHNILRNRLLINDIRKKVRV